MKFSALLTRFLTTGKKPPTDRDRSAILDETRSFLAPIAAGTGSDEPSMSYAPAVPTRSDAMKSMAELETAHAAMVSRKTAKAPQAGSVNAELWEKFLAGAPLGILTQANARGLIEKSQAALAAKGRKSAVPLPSAGMGQEPIKSLLLAAHSELRAAGIVSKPAEVYCKADTGTEKRGGMTVSKTSKIFNPPATPAAAATPPRRQLSQSQRRPNPPPAPRLQRAKCPRRLAAYAPRMPNSSGSWPPPPHQRHR